MAKKRGPKRRYTDDERKAAIALTQRIGFAAASEELGIPTSPLTGWAKGESLP